MAGRESTSIKPRPALSRMPLRGGEDSGMHQLRSLALAFALSNSLWAQELVVPLHGPLEMTGGGRTVKVESLVDAVLLSSGAGQVVARPFLYIKRTDLGPDGVVSREGAELFAEPYDENEKTIAARVSRGTELRVISDRGEVVLVYYPELPPFKMKSPRWFHAPGRVAWTRTTPGVSSKIVAKLKSVKTPSGKRFPYVFLPTWLPQPYTASVKEILAEDRFGPSYWLVYKNGSSRIGVDYATGGIGDRWLEEPKKILTVDHPYFGPVSVAKLSRNQGEWTTNWTEVPGVLTPTGDRLQNGHLGLTFSPDFSESEIKKVLLGLKAVE